MTTDTEGGNGKRHQEHLRNDRYLRYHKDVYMPDYVRDAALACLPVAGARLKSSLHYRELQHERHLPRAIYMPASFELIDSTVVASTRAVFRCMIRFRWSGPSVPMSRQTDLVLVVEPDGEVVTGYWIRAEDGRIDIDFSVYEQEPEKKEEVN